MPIWITIAREKKGSNNQLIEIDYNDATLKEYFTTLYTIIFFRRVISKITNKKMISDIKSWTKK